MEEKWQWIAMMDSVISNPYQTRKTIIQNCVISFVPEENGGETFRLILETTEPDMLVKIMKKLVQFSEEVEAKTNGS